MTLPYSLSIVVNKVNKVHLKVRKRFLWHVAWYTRSDDGITTMSDWEDDSDDDSLACLNSLVGEVLLFSVN